MLAKNGLIFSVGTKVSSRSLKTDGVFSVAMVRVSAFGSNWEPGVEADFRITPYSTRARRWMYTTSVFALLVYEAGKRESQTGPRPPFGIFPRFRPSTPMSSAQTVNARSPPLQVNSTSLARPCTSPNSSGNMVLGVISPVGSLLHIPP